MSDYRPLEGFVYAITPFNFTAIGGNLPTSPALMGNVAVWKPASSALLSGYYVMKLLQEAGLPPGVVNFVPGDSVMISEALRRTGTGGVLHRQHRVFNSMWKTIALIWGATAHIRASWVRRVGRTSSSCTRGRSTDGGRGDRPRRVRVPGQKCSAASRVYVPRSLWNEVRDRTVAIIETCGWATCATSATSWAR